MQQDDFSYKCKKIKYTTMTIFIPVWLRNRMISDGLVPVLSYTEKSCIPFNYRQFSITCFDRPGLRPLGENTLGCKLKFFLFNIREKCL